MNYKQLGKSGLKVSPLCLGMMSYGSSSWQPWVLDKSEAKPFVKLALDHGINFFDTSDFYSYGASEEALGEAVHGLCRREELVISTKVGMSMGTNVPNERGSSRKRIREGIDASLRRLKTDYVDLYLLHCWDPETPLEESIEALEDLVRAGKILYYGASNFRSWQLSHAQHVASMRGCRGLSATQLQCNLVYREEERETLPYCEAAGLGVMVYSPLARGFLVGGDADAEVLTERERVRVQKDAKTQALYGNAGDQTVRERLLELARRHGVPPGRLAMAWVLSKPQVSTALVGALEPQHLLEAVESLNITLSAEEIAFLEEPYVAGPLRTGGLKQVLAQQQKSAAAQS